MEKKKYKYVFFDLDGTITDPFVGICTCVKYSLERFGIYTEIQEHTAFIGPPLKDSYMKYYGFSEEEATLAIDIYRERYHDTGIFECELYPGIETLLEKLSCDATLVLATSKPEVYAVRILEHFGIKKYFNFIVGASFDEKFSAKHDILSKAISVSHAVADESVMVGDREFDTLAASKCGIDGIGALWGYGTPSEHEKAVFVAKDVKSLADFFGV